MALRGRFFRRGSLEKPSETSAAPLFLHFVVGGAPTVPPADIVRAGLT